jgi:hypothetical protein
MVHTLVLQILLGLGNTFWLSLPEEGNRWSGAAPAWLLMAHITLGVLLIVLGGAVLVLAFQTGSRPFKSASVLGIASIVVAFGAGAAFMGQDSDALSFVMALGCGLAIIFYATALGKLALPTSGGGGSVRRR